MANPTIQPYGCWTSTISADIVAGKTPRISEPTTYTYNGESYFFWLQSCPEEKGRVSILVKKRDALAAEPRNILPRPISAASKVHEYGGGSYCVWENNLYFVVADDQRIYSIDWTQAHAEPRPVTAQSNGNVRFADLQACPSLACIIAVCEVHSDHEHDRTEPTNKLVAINLHTGNLHTLHEGQDFYSNPRLSPCGSQLCWLSWNHPAMPWDNTQLWLATIDSTLMLDRPCIIKGEKKDQSIFQPLWHPNGQLFCVSDASEWWNIERSSPLNQPPQTPSNSPIDNGYEWQTVHSMAAEFATPQWVFGMKTFGFINPDTLFCVYTQNGSWSAATLNHCLESTSEFTPCTSLNHRFSEFEGVVANQSESGNGHAVFIAANAASLPGVYLWENTTDTMTAVNFNELAIDPDDISIPQAFSFPVADEQPQGEQSHAFYYPPTNAQHIGPADTSPPAIVLCHGGPTGATSTAFNPKIQYWTSRGFAVIDVNYRGSTGYGRRYRESLHKQWGLYDVDDMCAAKNYAVARGWAAADQTVIKGSSAGGYTVLAALAFRDCFSAGVSLYGIGDLETLASDTHKFEARYLDTLIGPYPEQKQEYVKRSPIHSVENIRCPLLVFQGMKDKVVPPNQAKNMVEKVRAAGAPVTYVTFENEGHGFRDAINIRTMLETELEFYQTTFSLRLEHV